MIVSDKVYRYTRMLSSYDLTIQGYRNKIPTEIILERESSIPFNDFDYYIDTYYGINCEIKNALSMTDKTTISHFLKINPHLEAKLDIIRYAQDTLRYVTHSHLDRQEFFNWLLTQMTPEEVKLGLTT